MSNVFILFRTSVRGETTERSPGMVGLAPKWVRLAPNGTNPGLFQIRFQCIWRSGAAKPTIPDESEQAESYVTMIDQR